jgi:uncharacterized membrane-anchored protein
MNSENKETFSKVPEVTLIFWVIKVLATTLGETGGDAVSMSMDLGYLVGTAIFSVIFVVAVVVQMYSRKFHPVTYWATIIATTTLGTTLADFADRSLGIGYAGGSTILLALLMCSLFVWQRTLGSIAVETVSSPKSEAFYWLTIMFSQTLGTALGDWVADTEGLGYAASAIIFGGLLSATALAYYKTKISHTILFWTAFILTRPLGAVVGDLLDKPISEGGLALSRYSATAALILLIVFFIFAFKHDAARNEH